MESANSYTNATLSKTSNLTLQKTNNIDLCVLSLESTVHEVELIHYLNIAKNIDDFIFRIRNLLTPIGITDFSHVCMNNICDILDAFGTYDPSITDKWAREGLHQDEMTTRHLLINQTPIFRSTVCQYIDAAPFDNEIFRRNREATRFMLEYGLTDVYNIPIVHDGYRALFSISSHMCDPDIFKKNVNSNLAAISSLAQAIDHVGTIKFGKRFHNRDLNPRVPIHSRPLQLIQVMADKGCTLNEAAAVLDMKISTANQHIAAAKKALRASTTHGMILEAQKEGLILVR